jgi:hypothetical protein
MALNQSSPLLGVAFVVMLPKFMRENGNIG